jgi:hypothetical protein
MSKDMSIEEANLAVATALTRQVVALRAENNRLREALRPFAKAGELFTERSMFSDLVVYLPAAGDAYKIVGDDLRRARAALEETEE